MILTKLQFITNVLETQQSTLSIKNSHFHQPFTKLFFKTFIEGQTNSQVNISNSNLINCKCLSGAVYIENSRLFISNSTLKDNTLGGAIQVKQGRS